jgi:hypothetical protein
LRTIGLPFRKKQANEDEVKAKKNKKPDSVDEKTVSPDN